MAARQPEIVWYVELRGAQALAQLTALLGTLPEQDGFAGAEVQASDTQPGLALLASRWTAVPPSLRLPDGAKHWTFRVLAAALP